MNSDSVEQVINAERRLLDHAVPLGPTRYS
jgi:hypothetical protein